MKRLSIHYSVLKHKSKGHSDLYRQDFHLTNSLLMYHFNVAGGFDLGEVQFTSNISPTRYPSEFLVTVAPLTIACSPRFESSCGLLSGRSST